MEVPDYSSRSDLNRCLLALAFAIFAISLIVHIASLFGVVLIPNGRWQIWGTWGLLLALPCYSCAISVWQSPGYLLCRGLGVRHGGLPGPMP